MLAAIQKNDTREQHIATKKVLVDYLKEHTSPERYIHLLETFFGFLKPLELKLRETIGRQIMPMYETLRTSAAIIEDLRVLGRPCDEQSIEQHKEFF